MQKGEGKDQILVAKDESEEEKNYSIFVERNLRNIRQPTGVERAGHGVSQSIQRHDVEPVVQKIIQTAYMHAINTNRKTVKHKHVQSALKDLGFNDIADFRFEEKETDSAEE